MATAQTTARTQARISDRTHGISGGSARERLLAGLPLSERRLQLGGGSTVVLEGGDGPPLILLHGGIESGGVYWAPVVGALAAHHRLVIPDAPGLGESEPLARLDAAGFAAWFAELLGATCDRRPDLVAHSMLSSLAARFATERGGLLKRLVLVGAPAIGPYHLPVGLLLAAIRSDLRPTERNLERFLPWPFLDPERTRGKDPEWFEAFLAYMLSRGVVPHVKRTLRQLIRAGKKRIPDRDLQQIGAPTALLWGRHDRMTPLRLAERASTSFDWPLHVQADVGHVPFVEDPEHFLVALNSALDDLRPAQTRSGR